jgi:hypothetical protein
MKWLLALVMLGAIGYAVASVPPRTAARLTARGLRAGWDWLASIRSEATWDESPARAPSRAHPGKAQAAMPQRRANRDGIVPQPPKETLHPSDRAALDDLLAHPARADGPR